MSGTLFKCRWCGKNRRPSKWEQKTLGSDEYALLCQSCARRRLGNPWNALLALRRISASAPADEEEK